MSGSLSRSLTLVNCGGAESVALAQDTWKECVRWGNRVSVRAISHGLEGFLGWRIRWTAVSLSPVRQIDRRQRGALRDRASSGFAGGPPGQG